jgi:predicted O-methyltransferase YrrM
MFKELRAMRGIEEMEPREFLVFLEHQARIQGLKHRHGSYYATLFLCSRWTGARNIIETGVGYGFSSCTLLASSPFVHLTSIDLPHKEYFEPTKYGKVRHMAIETGMAVPSDLRGRWELIVGDAKVELPKAVRRLPEIDVFLHDSEHTREHMMFEFETAFPQIRRGGVLLSDDVELNTAFTDFCKKQDLHYTLLEQAVNRSKVGVALKT